MSKVRMFLDKIEEAVVKSLDKTKDNLEKVEEKLDDEFEVLNDKWEQFEDKFERAEPLNMFQDFLRRRCRIEKIKENSKGRRHKSQKRIRRR